MGAAVQQVAVFLDELFRRQRLCQLPRLFRDKLFVIQLPTGVADASGRGGDTAAGGGGRLQHDAQQRKTRKGRFIDVIPPRHGPAGVIWRIRVSHFTPAVLMPTYRPVSAVRVAPTNSFPVEAHARCGRFVKIEALVHFQHTVQKGVAVLGETLVREGGAQRGQHFYDGGILLHVIGAELGKAAAGELLLGEIVQRLVNGHGHILAALVGRKGLYRLRSQQNIVEAVRLVVHARSLQFDGPFGGIAELAAALLAGKRFGQKLLPQGVELVGPACVTGGVQVHQHIQPVLVRVHQLRSLHGNQKVMTGEVGHIQPYGRHRADSAGDIARLAALCRNVHPVGQRLQVFVIEAAGDSCAGGPQGVDVFRVFLLRGRGKVVLALADALNDQLRHRLIRLLRLIRPAARGGSLYYDGQKHHQCQQRGE